MFEVFTQIYVNLSKKLKFMKIFRKNLWFFTSHQLFSHNQIFYEFFPIQNKNSQSAPKSLSSSIKSITISNHFRIAKQRLRKFSITLTSSLNHFSFFLYFFTPPYDTARSNKILIRRVKWEYIKHYAVQYSKKIDEEEEEQYNKSKQQQNQDSGDPEAPQLDELIPEKLERTEDPLSKAIDFLKPLQMLSQGLIETHLLTFEIYYRKNKVLIMLKALKKAYSIDPNSAALHMCVFKFIKLLETKLAEADDILKQVLLQEIKEELPILEKKPVELNEDYLKRNPNNSDALIVAAEILYEESPENNKTKAIELLKTSTTLDGFYLEVHTSFYSSSFKTLTSLISLNSSMPSSFMIYWRATN